MVRRRGRKMEDTFQENHTTRSLLKGILATEPVYPAVRHQSKQSALESERLSTTAYQNMNASSPSAKLRSKMKDRVRRSLGKSSLEVSTLTRKVPINPKMKQESAKMEPHSILKDLDKITPRTLLKKIIQNEDEVSILVSQRVKTAVDDDKQETTPNASLNSVGNVNLSLPDFQEKEHIAVFRRSRKKMIDISEFEREVDERLPNKENIVVDKIEVSSSSGYSYTMPWSVENKLDISAVPQSTYKSGLLRRPNKVCLVSLGDFEQGVEDKYQILKGSQECFIESFAENKSDASSNEVAQMNTELYVQPLLKEMNTPNSDKTPKRISKSFVSTYIDEKEAEDDFAETNMDAVSVNVQPKLEGERIFNSEAVIKKIRDVGSDRGEGEEIGTDFMDIESSVQSEKNQSSVTENGKLTGLDTFTPKMQNSRHNEENGLQTVQSINMDLSVSAKEDTYASSQKSTSENLLFEQRHLDFEISTFANKKQINKQPMDSGLTDTPVYMKNARFLFDNKPVAIKTIQRKNNVKPKKRGTEFTGNLVKQIFGLHAQMRVSKEASADIEKCLELYLDQLTGDLATYTAHACRRTITCADMELLMKR
ncbi:centromere protein T isoform X2 [Mixophyes fleayi]|uniref:centromere protein T isoform X2 n=1 Tax=Mixophyes fleayi TaxID=3061075 RepID=UPI003F4D97F4